MAMGIGGPSSSSAGWSDLFNWPRPTPKPTPTPTATPAPTPTPAPAPAPAPVASTPPASNTYTPAAPDPKPVAPAIEATTLPADAPTASPPADTAPAASLRTLYDQGIATSQRTARPLATIDTQTATIADRTDDQTARTRAEVIAQAAYSLVAQAGAGQSGVRTLIGNL